MAPELAPNALKRLRLLPKTSAETLLACGTYLNCWRGQGQQLHRGRGLCAWWLCVDGAARQGSLHGGVDESCRSDQL